VTGLYDNDIPIVDEIGNRLYVDLGLTVEACNKVLAVIIEVANKQSVDERRALAVFRNGEPPRCVN
jgi:hypothetical protein